MIMTNTADITKEKIKYNKSGRSITLPQKE
jgi:hypothetical protein